MRLNGWVLIQYGRCPYREGRIQKCADTVKSCVKTKQEGSHLQAQEKAALPTPSPRASSVQKYTEK